MTIPRINSIVKFDRENCPDEYWEKYYKKVFENKTFIFLGEVAQAPEHCILLDAKNNEILTMWHTEDFIELTDKEV